MIRSFLAKLTADQKRDLILCAVLCLAVWATYFNHFNNDFHFDDFHTTRDNIFIRDIHNVPRFFTNRALLSTHPSFAVYRPVTAASLAIDYRMGRGLNPFWFHVSTFLWLELQLVLMFFLFRRLMDLANPHPSNVWTAFAAAAIYGLHPAGAETVNYIIQRADLYNTLGVVASLLWFIAYPAQRKRLWFMLPALAAYLAKPPALVYPAILAAYIFLFEQDTDRRKWSDTARIVGPALAVTAFAAIFIQWMTPPEFFYNGASPWLYRLTQPWVALHYFISFFLPLWLSADTDWSYVSGPLDPKALAGDLFVLGLLAAIYYTARRRQTRPICFGIVWFIVTLLPTSLAPLGEVTNDHRMFFPFVGLTLSVVWSLRLAFEWLAGTAGGTDHRFSWSVKPGFVATLALVILAAEAVGAHTRNNVWRTEESLWRDVTIKSPKNGRGWQNYAVQFARRNDYATALSYFQRAQQLDPENALVEMNLGMTYANLPGGKPEAERHFRHSLELSNEPDLHYMYGNWLYYQHRTVEAQEQLEAAIRGNRLSFPARMLLMKIYSDEQNMAGLEEVFKDTIQMAYDNQAVERFEAAKAEFEKKTKEERAQDVRKLEAKLGKKLNISPSPERLTREGAELCKAGKFEECLSKLQAALDIRPTYAEAYNNKAYAYIGLNRLDDAIAAWREAVRLKPDYTIAKKNLAQALADRQRREFAKGMVR
jgi:protein O-mannosyl-transferase